MEHGCSDQRVALRRMPAGNLDSEPAGDLVERVAGKGGLGNLGQQPRVE